MCGLAGYFNSNNQMENVFLESISTIDFRGPDDSCIWKDSHDHNGLAHVRLSIMDLSDAGKQPFESLSGRYLIAYNGEIYNHLKLREELLLKNFDVKWRGHSDTETLIEAISCIGLDATLSFIDGMFAFALFDRQSKKLILVRDRAGEKPLYYIQKGSAVYFSSDIRLLMPISKKRIDKKALNDYIFSGFIKGSNSIYEDIKKPMPGKTYVYSLHDSDLICEERVYWRLKRGVKTGGETTAEIKNNLYNKLQESVRSCLLSDVKVGSFLSGGIDSSLITGLMQKNSLEKIKTFTVGFENDLYDESKYSKEIAQYFGTDHTEVIFSEGDVSKYLPYSLATYSEPFADPSQLPTLMVSKLAREHVTVALSGDGADELFGGYDRYIQAERINKIYKKIPNIPRKVIASACNKMSAIITGYSWSNIAGIEPENFSSKLAKVGNILGNSNGFDLYDLIMQQTENANLFVVPEFQYFGIATKSLHSEHDLRSYLMEKDRTGYLWEDILVKVDRASMFFSLETRAPFLSKEIIEFSSSLEKNMLFNKNKGKVILRDILDKILPKELFDRPKKGFGIPLADWLRNSLREYAYDMLSEQNIRTVGILNHQNVKKILNEHMNKKRNHQNILWNLIQFQSWALEYHVKQC